MVELLLLELLMGYFVHQNVLFLGNYYLPKDMVVGDLEEDPELIKN
jgi:Na+/glutamate symporter